MAKNKQVCDLQPGKGMTRAQSNEHLRNFSAQAFDRKRSGNFDPTREKLNFEVTKGGKVVPVDKKKSITKRIKDNLKARGIKDPNEGKEQPTNRTVANFILGGSREQMHRLAFGDQQVNLNKGSDNSGITRNKMIEDWAVDVYNFMARKYGEDNIIAFVVHLDETNPHVHCTVLPVTPMNKLSWKQVFAGKDKYEYQKRMKKLHDEFAEVNKKYGLERGDDITKTGAKHRTTEQYRDWLDEQSKNLEKEIDIKKATLRDLNSEIAKAERRVKGLTTMLSNLEVKKADIEQEIADLEEKLRDGRISNEEMQQRREVLTGQLNEVVTKIQERQQQLSKAQQQLQEIADRRAVLEDQAKDFEKRIKDDLPTVHEKTIKDMQSTGWKLVAEEAAEKAKSAGEYKENLSYDERKVVDKYDNAMFDGSIFEEMAERANEISAVAAALFLGYIDQATTFAQSHGGGGGSPGKGWGRKKDDDDESWRRQCFFMGMKMMRPAGRKLKR